MLKAENNRDNIGEILRCRINIALLMKFSGKGKQEKLTRNNGNNGEILRSRMRIAL